VVTLAAFMAAAPARAQQQNGAAQPDPAATQVNVPPPADEPQGAIARARAWADRTQIADRLSGDIDGWYPRLGGMTRGGGFAIGPGYRTHLGNVLVDLSAGISIRSYKAVDAKVRWLNAFDERLELWTSYRYEDFPQEDFFGTGPDSSLDARTSY